MNATVAQLVNFHTTSRFARFDSYLTCTSFGLVVGLKYCQDSVASSDFMVPLVYARVYKSKQFISCAFLLPASR